MSFDRQRSPRARRLSVTAVVLAALALSAAACGSSGSSGSATAGTPAPGGTFPPGTEVRLLTHDSFAVSDDVLAEFEASSRVKVTVVKGGDAVEMVNKAVLTAGDPQGDVLYGIDNNLLTRAYDNDLFVPYASPGLTDIDPAYQLDAEHRVTPVDVGDVCVNFDREYFTSKGLAVPQSLDDLVKPEYKGLLVVQDPTSSTPGLAFLLATIAHAGGGDSTDPSAAWVQYWTQLQANGVTVSPSWEQAYNELFSGGSGRGSSPLVVSYASSPPAEVTNADTPVDQAPTGVVSSTCFRQIEFAGVLRGTGNEAAAQALVDFLVSKRFQEDMPLNMYVYPVNRTATVPESFTKYSAVVADPLSLTPEEIGANRDRWVQQWAAALGR